MNHQTIGEIVAQDYRAANVFKRYGIDFCCGGKRSVADACIEKGVDLAVLEQELSELNRQPSPLQMSYQNWSADFLADYIINRHHAYVRKATPEITAYAEKVAKVHGKRHPETVEIFYNWKALSSELESHLLKEENILFPYIKKMAKTEDNQSFRPPFGTVQNPINIMEMEHDEAGELIHAIRKLSNDFTPPEDACTTYRVLFSMLEEFENDLHEHVHIENNILFPKAIGLEEQFKKAEAS
ncbi:MAG: iron-sulfur cluster repair di-iron protein [Saprospiraceae bacterium]|nr:iron-sulfur cluster repair di-iron protein [Saprospiraceae bacterium]